MKPISVSLAAEQLRRRVPGGIGTYARGLLKGLGELPAEERPDLRLVASRPPVRPDPLEDLGYPVESSWLPGPLMTRAWDMGLTRTGRGSDVVHSVSLAAPVPSSKTSLVLTVHDVAWRSMPEAYPPRGRRWHKSALRRAARRADVVIVPSQATAAAVVAAGVGITEDRVVTVPEGADHLGQPDEAAAQVLLESLSVQGPYLLTVSTLEPRKNLDRLVQAYALIRPRLPDPWPLLVVGPSGWGPSGSAGGPRPAAGVVFAGAVGGGVLAAIYGGARCCAYVPIVEGFGLPVVEAMSQGTPVVSSPVPSTGGASLEVDPKDVSSIAQGLLAASSDEPIRRVLIASGLDHASSLRWVDAARAHVEVWRRVAAARGNRR